MSLKYWKCSLVRIDDDAFSQADSNSDQKLLQFIDVIHFSLVDFLLYFSPQILILVNQIWTVSDHISDKINADICHSSRLIVLHARWDDVLSYSMTTNSSEF